MRKYLPLLIIGLFALAGSILETGCKSRPLAAGGAYNDSILYQADKTILDAEDILHTFVRWEHDNRAALAGTTEISKAADVIRANARKWVESAMNLREAYRANPTEDTRSNLTKALDVLRQALTEASNYMAQPVLAK